MRSKIFFASGILLFAILACNLQTGVATPTPMGATNTPVPPSPTHPSPPPPMRPYHPRCRQSPPPHLPILISRTPITAGVSPSTTAATFLRTVDGGMTWLNATPPGIGSVGYSTSLFVLNVNTVWVLVPGSGLLHRHALPDDRRRRHLDLEPGPVRRRHISSSWMPAPAAPWPTGAPAPGPTPWRCTRPPTAA